MRSSVSPELIAALLEVAGVSRQVLKPEAAAKWLGDSLANAAPEFDRLAFEDEPSGFEIASREGAA